jgi:hypothetical protein
MHYRTAHHTPDDYTYKGVPVCDRWSTFENFLADMGERPPGHTLDRIDNTKGYAPSNCRWATVSEQNRNQRRRRHYKGLPIKR